MKFTVKKAVILDALEKAVKGLANTTSIPILGGILLEISNDELVLTGSSNDTTVREVVPVDNEDIILETPGATVLQRKTLEIIKKMKDGDITFSTDEKDFTTITSKSVEFEIAGHDAKEFPVLPEIDKGQKASIILNGKEFQDIVRKTSFCAATSETRPLLQAVLFDIKSDCINFTATDSHRLGRVIYPSSNNEVECQYPVPSDSVVKMTKVFDFTLDVEIFVLSNSQAVFRNGKTTFYCRLLEGNYPDTSRLIPTDFQTEIRLNRKEFEKALEQCAILADDGKNSVVKMEIQGLMVSLKSAVSQRGKGKVEISYSDFVGEELAISFSSKYALDSVKAYDSEEVTLQFMGAMRPFIIKPVQAAGGLNSIQLILPVRTN
ncbi:DNA polymerase III subunit beta [Sutcliffiella cohnii]|uniref:DNA polymerase III subunit beta n=1 Tax=Sutcliffiella cohnii TaxID=33932 RepID=UPI0008295621|nr:DNA polymerase III subunit beta [Sutcliffiella cohnii]